MASDGNSGPIPATSSVQGSQAPIAVPSASHTVPAASGKSLPPGGKNVPQAVAPAPRTDSQALVDLLNKHLNDSGQPDQFRVDPASNELIQQINPANGAVVGQFSIDEFPALARSVGASGGIVDDRA
jgi:hypothetical protein